MKGHDCKLEIVREDQSKCSFLARKAHFNTKKYVVAAIYNKEFSG